jgi:hypothetical protein
VSFETRARNAAEQLRATAAVDTEAGLDRLRRTHRRRSTARVSGVVAAAVLVVLVAGPGLVGDRDSAEPAPVAPPSSAASPSPSASTTTPRSTGLDLIDTSAWTTYTSEQYGFAVGHPPAWEEIPASRRWTPRDVGDDVSSPALDTFRSPSDDVRASVWSVPLEPGTPTNSIPDLVAWAQAYCEESGITPCAGIGDRAVELCLEQWDCHPALLVPFDTEVQAFFSGGIYDAEAMTVVAVWRPESHRSVAPYGGAQRLLEGFLSTMQVWRASSLREERECYGGPPDGYTCRNGG